MGRIMHYVALVILNSFIIRCDRGSYFWGYFIFALLVNHDVFLFHAWSTPFRSNSYELYLCLMACYIRIYDARVNGIWSRDGRERCDAIKWIVIVFFCIYLTPIVLLHGVLHRVVYHTVLASLAVYHICFQTHWN